jgi:hypothetical protein
MKRSLTVRSLRGVLAASVCLLAVPVALLFQLIVGGGAEIVLHLVAGVGCVLTAFAVFDFEPPRWLPWVGCLSIGAFGATFLLQGISQLLHIDWLTYLAFQILGQQVEALSVDVFLVWCSATVLLMSHGKIKLFGICVLALAASSLKAARRSRFPKQQKRPEVSRAGHRRVKFRLPRLVGVRGCVAVNQAAESAVVINPRRAAASRIPVPGRLLLKKAPRSRTARSTTVHRTAAAL